MCPASAQWGFVLASRRPWKMPARLPPDLRLSHRGGTAGRVRLPARHGAACRPSRTGLSNQILVTTFEAGMGKVH
jgi:spermidine synthase